MNDEQLYNGLTTAASVNLFHFARNPIRNGVVISDINCKNKSDLCILKILSSTANLINYDVYLDLNPITYFYLRRKYNLSKSLRCLKFYKWAARYFSGVSPHTIVNDLETANNAQGAFEKIAEEFYGI